MYLEQHPELLDQVASPGLFLDTVPEVGLAVRLHEFGLLPEEKRQRFVKTVSDYAVRGEDMDALDDDDVRTVFTDDEYNTLVQNVRTQLLPRLGAVCRQWEADYTSDSPESHMQQLIEGLETLKRKFGDDDGAVEIVEKQLGLTNDWVAEHQPDEPDRPPRKLGKVEKAENQQGARSIFDDIDADVESEGE